MTGDKPLGRSPNVREWRPGAQGGRKKPKEKKHKWVILNCIECGLPSREMSTRVLTGNLKVICAECWEKKNAPVE
jgi:hypothetical protein